MGQLFSSVFNGYSFKEDLGTIFADCTINNLIMVDNQRLLKVFIQYDKLIIRKYIKSLESNLAEILKDNGVSKVKILEKYRLPEQYTPAVWFENYKESIRSELFDYDYVFFTMFKGSEFSFTDENTLSIVVPENPIYKLKELEFTNILDKIANERFGYNINFTVSYKEATKSRYRMEYEKRAQLKEEEISRRVESLRSGNPDYASENGGVVLPSDMPTDNNGEIAATNAEANTSVMNGEASPVVKVNPEPKPVQKSEPKAAEKAPEKKSFGGGSDDDGSSYYKGKFKKAGKGGDRKGFTDYNKLINSDNPNVIYKHEFEGDYVDLSEMVNGIGDVIIRGQILAFEKRFLERSGKYLCTIEVSDFTNSLKIKLFLKEELMEEFEPLVKTGEFISAKGIVEEDTYDHELELSNPQGIMKISDWRAKRSDDALEKRVELHCHTKMSDMDAVSDIGSIIKQAKKFGHTALAITDHGNVQSFPLGFHALDKGDPFKLLYGVEGYLVNDNEYMSYNPKGQSYDGTFVVFDIETTGFSKDNDRIIEIGAVKIENMKVVDRFSEFVNPGEGRVIPLRIEKLTSITDEMVAGKDEIDVILPKFLDFCGDAVLVAHNARFDVGFIEYNAERLGIKTDITFVDTMSMSRFINVDMARHNLDALCKKYKVVNEHHHRAVDDAEVTSKIFLKMIPQLIEKGITNVTEMRDKGTFPDEVIAKLRAFHIIILAKNEVGRRNLYKLVSMSNVQYFHARPKIPKSKIMEYREGLIIGSACERGEIYSAIIDKKTDAEMAALVDFYDYLEIQPLGNNKFQIADEKFEDITSVEDLKNVNRKIVELGEIYHKPVCATGDVHFLNPEDEIYRRIILAGKGMNEEEQPPLFYRTTDEMLAEFDYLGTDKAFEVVVKNTNAIADRIEYITPVRPDKCPPVIENSDEQLRIICYNKAHEMYGENLPDIVQERLERELKSIIGNGYAVMYIIAQKLVWKSVEDGYLVGSRGSVGSSFAATMAGITEVNPLSPHYYCKKCHYSDFYSDDVKKFAGMAGCDMPDKDCPECGEPLVKDGFDIPFETFLGFKGDKEPDIDLNFSGEYQSKAHKYTEVIFGFGQTFRAGTISGLADKTAYGFVKKYFEEQGVVKRDGEIVRIAKGCEGVRRTTGQHPGGIVVLPVGEDINSFTPLQKPANDMKTDIITTHFEYHSIDHNLLKLDILGHDDPTMIRMLQDLTGVDPVTIPLDDQGVMSLFQDLSALNLTPEDIGGCPLGSLGIPEFGTDFAMQMLVDTKPQHFSDLVRIAGLSHGTNVWLGNAEKLIKEGTATISEAICTRDDIMTYLIGMGLDPAESFSIMENVRKGKVAKGKCKEWPAWKEDMLAHGVPEWYTWSCELIEYMFPKAHAAAYVMMAWRIAYCKINHPLAYYCSFFSIRAKAFSYETMCMGRATLEEALARLREKEKLSKEKTQDKEKKVKFTPSDEASLKDLRIVQEMYARGFSFWPIDIYKAKAKIFQIIDGKIMPALTSIEGFGESAAVLLEDAAKNGKFISKEDLKNRAKMGQSTIDKLSALGLLDGMPETSQLSIFDFT